MVGSAALHLSVNFYRVMSSSITYKAFDSNFCLCFLWDPTGVLCTSLKSHPALYVLSLQGGVCCFV